MDYRENLLGKLSESEKLMRDEGCLSKSRVISYDLSRRSYIHVEHRVRVRPSTGGYLNTYGLVNMMTSTLMGLYNRLLSAFCLASRYKYVFLF